MIPVYKKNDLPYRVKQSLEFFIKTYNREPYDLDELEHFYEIVNDISIAYDVSYDQITSELMEKYMKLLNIQ